MSITIDLNNRVSENRKLEAFPAWLKKAVLEAQDRYFESLKDAKKEDRNTLEYYGLKG